MPADFMRALEFRLRETNDHQQEHIGGLKDFINHTNVIGNVIAAASSQKNSFEPLPFANYSLFEESYGKLCTFCTFLLI